MSNFKDRYKGTRLRTKPKGFSQFASEFMSSTNKIVKKMGNLFGGSTAKAEEKDSYPNMQRLKRR